MSNSCKQIPWLRTKGSGVRISSGAPDHKGLQQCRPFSLCAHHGRKKRRPSGPPLQLRMVILRALHLARLHSFKKCFCCVIFMALDQGVILSCHNGCLALIFWLSLCKFTVFHFKARLENLCQSCLAAIFFCNSLPGRSHNIFINCVASFARPGRKGARRCRNNDQSSGSYYKLQCLSHFITPLL